MSGLAMDVRASRGGFCVEAALAAAPGETVALLGPNGAGKSTLVAVLAGLLAPERGTVTLDGSVLDGPGVHVPARERSAGVMFQDLRLLPHLSALGNVAFPLRARGLRRSEAEDAARAMLERVGAAGVADARPGSLSGGQAARVALARAMAGEPALLLLDEPLGSLDVEARGAVRALLREALGSARGVRVLVTHDPADAMTLAQRIVILEAGRVTQAGTTAEIRDAPRTAYAAELVGLNLFVGRLEPIGGGAASLQTERGSIVVAAPPGAPADDVAALVRPADVALFLDRPDGSARNVLRGTVEAITIEADRVRVRIGSAPPVVAEITPGSLDRLGLREGAEVWAAFKAVEARLVLPR